MKNKIQSLVYGVVVAFLLLFVGVAHAQKDAQVDKPKAPSVPIEVITRGYQAVTSYLLKQTKYIRYKCVGGSVFNSPEQADRWIYLPQHLPEYVPGSFESLSDALASQQFNVQLIANSLGMYDVHLEISYVTSDNEVAFTGYGHMSVLQNMDCTGPHS